MRRRAMTGLLPGTPCSPKKTSKMFRHVHDCSIAVQRRQTGWDYATTLDSSWAHFLIEATKSTGHDRTAVLHDHTEVDLLPRTCQTGRPVWPSRPR